MFDVFGKRSSRKVFLTDIDAVYFWMDAVKEKLKEKGSDDSVVLLRISQKEVDAKKLQYDKKGSGESSGNDWYATKVIGAPETQNESVLLEGWVMAPEQHPGDYRDVEPDDYYYHVTSKDAAQGILKSGLKPGKPALFTNYSARTKGRVFLADKNGVDFWMEHVELHLFANKDYDEDEDPADDVVVLRIPKSEVTAKLSVDKEGTDDSRANAWYATSIVESMKDADEDTFLGYHCSHVEIKGHDDSHGFFSHDYAPDWLHRLLKVLEENRDKEAKSLCDELDQIEDDQASVGYKQYVKLWNDWSERGIDHLNSSGWAWIFVSGDPDKDYGEHCYKVHVLPGTKYEELTDYNHPGASAIFYNTEKGGLRFDKVSESIQEAKQRPGGWIGPVCTMAPGTSS